METSTALLEKFESYLQGLDYSREPDGLYAPVRYVLSLGGKRLRPAFLLMACNMYTDNLADAMGIAAGIEVFHNFTLLHDDVMDRADMRRGKPTVHVKWNENTAILSGDVMVFIAYRYLAKHAGEHLNEILRIADETFTGVADGQQYDMDFESRDDVSESEYMEMIRLKTSVLVAGALQMGAVMGNAPESDSLALYRFGELFGLAFQLQDDLLDVYGDPKVFGKKIGGDILCNKKTFMYIKARELASETDNAELDRWAGYQGDDSQMKIDAVTAIYDKLGIRQCCEDKINGLFAQALKEIDSIAVPQDLKSELLDFVGGLLHRQL